MSGDTSTSEPDNYGPTFSARTCLDLLPLLSDEQVDREIKHLLALDPTSTLLRTRFPSSELKKDSLFKSLTKTLCCEVDKISSNFDTVISNFSCSLREAQSHIDQLTNDDKRSTVPAHSSSNPGNAQPLTLDDPVRFLDIDFKDITPESIFESFDFKDGTRESGNRDTLYFGNIGYKYGRYRHEPCPYPNSPIFDTIFDRLKSADPNFTPDNYTCLINRYPDGTSTIPFHHDDEESIVENTNIFTLSFGATRTIRCQNTGMRASSPFEERCFKLEHGSVFTMTHESQSIWCHGISAEVGTVGPRVSFTFRQLCVDKPKREIPRIARPNFTQGRDKCNRILLLTDSILQSCPTNIFSAIPNHKCIKKTNYQLCDIFKFDQEFHCTDIVVISAGVNDLSRHGHTAASLADIVCNGLKSCCSQYPRTKFVYNSILLTKLGWLNTEITEFNKIMYGLCRSIPNLTFFNSHQLLRESRLSYVVDPRGNGVHVTLDAKKLVTRNLVDCLKQLVGFRVTNQGDTGRRIFRGNGVASTVKLVPSRHHSVG